MSSEGNAPGSAKATGTGVNKTNVTALMVALLAACVAFQLNASMLSPALVTMGKELNTDQASIGLSQTWFFTAAAVFSLFLPRLSDIVGRKKVLIAMMVLMAIGSIISAVAPDITWVFVGRIIQGVSGPTVPLALIMLRSEVTDPKRYGALMGLITAVNGGIAGIDSFAGGYLAQHFGFRSIFWVMVVLGLIAAALVAVFAKESKPGEGTRMDWLGVLFIVIAVGALLTALNEATALLSAYTTGTLLWTLALVATSAIAFVLFWMTEKRAKQPMVEIVHLKQRAIWATLLTTVLAMTGIFAVINGIVPQFVQAAKPGFHIDATVMSLIILTPYALLGWAFGPITGRLAPVWGYTKVLRIGLIGSVLSLAIIAFLGLHNLGFLIAGTALLGISYAGTVNIMLNGLGVVNSPKNNPGFLPGMNAGAFNLGAGVSFLLLPAILLALGSGDMVGSYTTVIVVALVLTALALAASMLIPKPTEAEINS